MVKWLLPLNDLKVLLAISLEGKQVVGVGQGLGLAMQQKLLIQIYIEMNS